MKKLLILMLAICLVFCLSACGGDTASAGEDITGVVFNDASFVYDGEEKSIEISIKPNPHTALVRYGARTLSFEQKRPPSSAVTKMATYPIGSTSEVGSGVARAIAVPIRSRASPVALVMSSPTPPVRSVF